MRSMLMGLVILSGLTAFTTAAEGEKPAWKAAAAKAKITPTEPMFMAGYASRTKPSEGVALDLYAKVLVLEDSLGQQQVMVTLDLIGVPRSMRERLERRVADQFQLKPEALFINASHTHCGPELRVAKYEESGIESDRTAQAQAYTAKLENAIVDLIADCRKGLEPARVSYSHARCGFAMNRRLPTPTGYQNSPYPDGPVDHDVPVLRVDSPDGKTLHAILFGYACHNTTLGFQQFCSDYAGFAQQALEDAHPGTIALFVLGCGGDQNPYPRGQLEQCQQHGRALANAVETALLPTPKVLTGPLSRAIDVAVLQFAPPASRLDLLQQAESKNRFEASHAKRLLKQLEEDGTIALEYPAITQVIRFGSDLTFIAMSGEVVVDYSLRLKRELPGETVWVAGYCNDVFGYVPSQRVLKEGGYEGGGAMLYTSFPGPFADDVERRLISKIHELLKATGPDNGRKTMSAAPIDYLDLHEEFYRSGVTQDWQTFKTVGDAFTLHVIEQRKPSITLFGDNQHLKELTAAIQQQHTSDALSANDARNLLEVAAFADITCHNMEHVLRRGAHGHVGKFSKQSDIQRELYSIRAAYRSSFEDPDLADGMAERMREYARKLIKESGL